MKRTALRKLGVAGGCFAALALVLWLGAVQVLSMAAYGDLATQPSLPAFIHASISGGLSGPSGNALQRASALVHEKRYDEAANILAALPHDPLSDDVRGDLAHARGDDTGALHMYESAGDTLRAQAIVDAVYGADPQRAVAAQTGLVRALVQRGVAGDLLADAWWKLGERQRAVGDERAGNLGSRDALQSFEQALAQAPNRKSYLLAAGIEALKLGDDATAARFLTHAIEVGPGNANAYGALALAYAAQKNCVAARAEAAAWRTHADANARAPEDDPQFGAALRDCLSQATDSGFAATAAPTVAPAPRAPAATSSQAAAPATAGPHILSVVISPLVVHSGSHVSGSVKTSLDVVRLTVAVIGVPPIDVPKLGEGSYGASGILPQLPANDHGNYAVTFTAYDEEGRTATAVVGVSVP